MMVRCLMMRGNGLMNLKSIYKYGLMLSGGFLPGVLADTDYEHWQKALAALRTADIVETRAHLEAINSKGYGPWHMTGLLEEKENNLIKALLAYKRAQKEASLWLLPEAVAAVARVQRKLNQPPHVCYEYALTLVYIVWPVMFQVLFLMGWAGALRTMRYRRRYLIKLFIAVFMIIAAGWLLSIQRMIVKTDRALVVQPVALFIGPSDAYQKRARLLAGDEVIVKKITQDKRWYKVKQANIDGWVPADVLERI